MPIITWLSGIRAYVGGVGGGGGVGIVSVSFHIGLYLCLQPVSEPHFWQQEYVQKPMCGCQKGLQWSMMDGFLLLLLMMMMFVCCIKSSSVRFMSFCWTMTHFLVLLPPFCTKKFLNQMIKMWIKGSADFNSKCLYIGLNLIIRGEKPWRN